ncbi:hypothetical protein PUMCH_003045 [Australozyma saopauloensis]|uniref:tRNA-splicing endonuclease subunit Sen34 n=1 Tax=Australozyma saopauloensis TaxID=291208 RepID=A0AAX4HAX4_9ASCO|nr:hypothetical protein PUMCH_003045 [[Candida] saopauloensis]
MGDLIPLVVNGGSILVFELSHVKRLRDLGIVGILSGTLPKAPQQNVFLGLPLRLSIYEAAWLVNQSLGVLVDGLRYNEQVLNISSLKEETVELQGGVEYVVTEDTYSQVDDEQLAKICRDAEISVDALMVRLFGSVKTRQHLLSAAFNYFRDRDYYLMPGLRFGGDFVAYPGDPLKFHSHLILKVLEQKESFDLLQLVTSGRLATAVKKAWVLVGESSTQRNKQNQKPSLHCFSIEWAGFG